MKPHGPDGVTLETVGEAMALAEIMEHTRRLTDPGNSYYEILGQTAMIARERAAAYTEEKPDAPFSLHFADQTGGDLVRTLVRVNAESHPDPLVRDAAKGMQRSYEDAVFVSAMGSDDSQETPPEPAGE